MAYMVGRPGYGNVASFPGRWHTQGRGPNVRYVDLNSSDSTAEALNAGVRAAIKTMEDGAISQDTCKQIIRTLLVGYVGYKLNRCVDGYLDGPVSDSFGRVVKEWERVFERAGESAGTRD